MRKTVMLVVFLLVLWTLPVFAQGVIADPPPGSASELLALLLKIVFTVLGSVVTFLGVKAIQYFQKKTNIDIPASTEKMIFDWADHAIGLADEKAYQVLQQTGRKLDGNEKLVIATNFIMDLVKKHQLDEIAEAKVKDYIEAKLGIKRQEDGTPDTTQVVAVSIPPTAPTT